MSVLRRRQMMYELNKYIDFEDPNAEELCLKYFDTDNDGRISFDDLANVNQRMINAAYQKIDKDTQLKVRVVKFNEFKYFVGIDTIPYAFFGGFSNLEEVELPVVENLGATFAYIYAYKLKKVIIPEGTKTIGALTFLGALAPNSVIKIPASITEIGDNAFSWKKDVTFIFYGNTPPEIVGNWNYSAQTEKEKLIVGYAPDESITLYKNSPIIGKICSDILPISQYKG